MLTPPLECRTSLMHELVDHQVGLLSGVRDIPLAELKSNVVSLAKATRTLKVPTVVTTTARDSMWGPTFPELVSALPDAKIIDRSSGNAWDDPKAAAAIEATGRKKLIFAGLSLEVCAAFPALHLRLPIHRILARRRRKVIGRPRVILLPVQLRRRLRLSAPLLD